MSYKKTVVLGVFCVGAIAPVAHGQEESQPVEILPEDIANMQIEDGGDEVVLDMSMDDLMDLGLVVEVATKTETTLDEAPSSVSVITAAEILQLGLRNLDDVLNLVPGFDVRRATENLQITDVRGVSGQFNERILIMVDGVKVNDVYNGGSARTVRRISLANVERVEIIRGPGSALYGTNAFAAVVNVVTKKGSQADALNVNVEYGRFNDINLNAMGAYEKGGHAIAVFGGFGHSTGERYFIEDDAVGNSGYVRDRHREYFASAKYSYKKKFEVNASMGIRKDYGFLTVGELIGTHAGDDIDINTGNWATASANYVHTFNDTVSLNTKVFGAFNHWGENTTLLRAPGEIPPFPNGLWSHPKVQDYRYGVDSFVNVAWGKQQLIAGFAFEGVEAPRQNQYDDTNGPLSDNPDVGSGRVLFHNGKCETYPDPAHPAGEGDQGGTLSDDPDYIPNYNEALKRDDGFCDKGRKVFAGYAQHTLRYGEKLSVTAGVRLDYYNDFGSTFNPRIGVVYSEKNNFFLKAIYGQAFRAPTFRELSLQNVPSVAGNPDLGAEVIQTVEFTGGGYVGKKFNVSFTLFYNHVKDIIRPIPQDVGIPIYGNDGEVDTFGFEGLAKYNINRNVQLFLTHSTLSSKNTISSGAFDLVKDNPFVARNISNLGVRGSTDKYYYGSYLLFRGVRERNEGDSRTEVAGRNLFLNAQIGMKDVGTKGLDLYISGRNLLDLAGTAPSAQQRFVPGTMRTETAVPSDIPYRGIEVMVGARMGLSQ